MTKIDQAYLGDFVSALCNYCFKYFVIAACTTAVTSTFTTFWHVLKSMFDLDLASIVFFLSKIYTGKLCTRK